MAHGAPSPAHSARSTTSAAFPRCKKKTLRISDARLQAVDSQLCRAEERLEEIRRVRARNLERQRELEEEADGWIAQRDARLERGRRMEKSAARMQSVARGFFARCFVLPALRAEKDVKDLQLSRQMMREKMLHMQQCIHDVHYLELDRGQAALNLQTWWRSVLARRITDLLRIRTKVLEVRQGMSAAATVIQAVHRGNAGRQAFVAKLAERAREERLAREEELRGTVQSVIKVQSLCRRKQARKTVAHRRRERARGIKAAEQAETEAARAAALREEEAAAASANSRRKFRARTADFKSSKRGDDKTPGPSPLPAASPLPPLDFKSGRPAASPSQRDAGDESSPRRLGGRDSSRSPMAADFGIQRSKTEPQPSRRPPPAAKGGKSSAEPPVSPRSSARKVTASSEQAAKMSSRWKSEAGPK